MYPNFLAPLYIVCRSMILGEELDLRACSDTCRKSYIPARNARATASPPPMSPRIVLGRTNRAEMRQAKLHHETSRGARFVHQAAVEVVGFAHFLQTRVCAFAQK